MRVVVVVLVVIVFGGGNHFLIVPYTGKQVGQGIGRHGRLIVVVCLSVLSLL